MQKRRDDDRDRLSPPIEIQRPSSALHAGDFTHETNGPTSQPSISPGGPKLYGNSSESFGTSPTTPWYNIPSPSFLRYPSSPPNHLARDPTNSWARNSLRSRAPSIGSYSSSYVLKAPTSPLVQQSNNTDLDFSPADLSPSPERINRRHTLPPHALQASPDGPSRTTSISQDAGTGSIYPRDRALSYQRHQARRSLTSNWSLQVSNSPQSPGFLRSRRTSYSETSPLHNASMVGSFEESILRGSMSTAPSKPLDFTAQIGVLGKGNCKPKCPAHVIVPFPAVFYSWGGSIGRNPSMGFGGEPSPYVGHIDLQSSLSPPEQRRGTGDHNVREREAIPASGETHDDGRDIKRNLGNPKKGKKRRRSLTPVVTPPGGSYRIPQQGQLQIIIKNPNKTAVKLFLVPYDLTGMESETKTFIRQRCYSTELVDDGLMASTQAPAQLALSSRLDEMKLKKKPTLRYLIHLNICCPSPGRFYLYQHIRVVFANRVPDNKELLQNEIQVPQPRFSPYRATMQDSPFGRQAISGARSTNEKAYRRRSSGYDPYPHVGGSNFSFNTGTPAPPIPPLPFNLTSSSTRRSRFDVGDGRHPACIEPGRSIDMETESQVNSPTPIQPLSSSSYRSNSSHSSEGYEKLNKGDSGYGGVFFGKDGPVEGGEGLLARKLKGLGMRGMRVEGNDGEHLG